MKLIKNKSNKNYNDEKLIELAQQKHEEAILTLIKKYKYIVTIQTKNFFLPGSEYDDLFQEGLIGLFKSIRDYNPNKNIPFECFANMCVKRQLITAIKASNRQKHKLLNNYISFNLALSSENNSKKLIHILPNDNCINPEDKFIMQKELDYLINQIKEILSPLEYNCLVLYIDDYTYKQIADELEVHLKAVTNAMYRVRKKLKNTKRERCIV